MKSIINLFVFSFCLWSLAMAAKVSVDRHLPEVLNCYKGNVCLKYTENGKKCIYFARTVQGEFLACKSANKE